MRRSSHDEIRDKIIGLGDASSRKSYYPMLRDKIRDLQEKQVQLMETVRTLEERESELEALLEVKSVLLSEVNHRVNNNLQIIMSLLNLTSASVPEDLRKPLAKTQKRIDTISVIYQDFLFSESYSEVPFCAFIRAISEQVRFDHSRNSVYIEYSFPITEIIIHIEEAIPLALIVNEVLMNSFEHAFPEGLGTLSISMKPCRGNCEGVYRLVISDEGPGFDGAASAAENEALGMLLIESLAAQLGAVYNYTGGDGGAVFSLDYTPKRKTSPG